MASEHGEAAVRLLELYLVAADGKSGLAVDGYCDFLEQVLHEFHHPDIVLVGHVDLHAGEFRVVGLVHAFVAEVLGKLVYSCKASDYQPLEVELIGDAQVQRDVEGIVVGDEGACVGASRYGLQDGCLHFHVSEGVEILPHGLYDAGPLDEYVLDVRVDHQVHVSHAVAELGV